MTDAMRLLASNIADFIMAEGLNGNFETSDIVEAATIGLAIVTLSFSVEGHEADTILDVIGMFQEAGVYMIEAKRGEADESDSVQRHH